MRKKRYCAKAAARLLAIFLAVTLILGVSLPESFVPVVRTVFADDADGMHLSLDWADSEFKNGQAMNVYEPDRTSNAVKLRVSYNSEKVRESGYAPGELIITLKGLGPVYRGVIPEAAGVGADPSDADTKTRDWTYSYNGETGEYTFVNNGAIRPNSVFSGYFDIVWNLDARKCTDGFAQDDIRASFLLPDGSEAVSDALSFSHDTKCDVYGTGIDTETVYSYEGLTAGIPNPGNYIFVRYNLSSPRDLHSRGLKEGPYYYFDPDKDDIGSGAIVISPAITCEGAGGDPNAAGTGTGVYRVGIEPNGKAGSQHIFVAYPAETYGGRTVTASLSVTGDFHEGDDDGTTGIHVLSQASLPIALPNTFTFTDTGGAHKFYKDANIDTEMRKKNGGDIKGIRMLSGATQTYDIYSPYAVIPHAPGATLELADDFLYITQVDGNWRKLGPSDYEFSKLSIPGTDKVLNSNDVPVASGVYGLEIYAVQDGALITKDPENLFWTGFLTEDRQDITLPAGTTAWMVRLTGIMETIRKFTVTDTVVFHLDEGAHAENEKADLVNGLVANTAFGFLRDEHGTWLNVRTDENYIDGDINLDLAAQDMDLYGTWLDREESFIQLYEGEKSNFSAVTSVGTVTNRGRDYTAGVTIGADFDFAEEDHPNRFSLYTILPEGLILDGFEEPEDIWDIMTLSGMGMTQAELAAACTPEVIRDYDGRTYVGLHFDLDGRAPQDGKIRAVLKTATTKAFFNNNISSIYVRSCVLMDQAADNIYKAGKYADNGRWYDRLWSDIDRDGNTEELLSWNSGNRGIYFVDSSQLELNKSVRTDHTAGAFVQYPSSSETKAPLSEYGSGYTYMLSLKNGNSLAQNIVLTDILETGPNAAWQGTFRSVDISEAEAAGLTGTVWYSDTETPGPVGGDGWAVEMEPAMVKAVAVDFGESVLPAGQTLDIFIEMDAPSDAAIKDMVTENGFSASFTMIDEATGNTTQADTLNSNLVRVRLTSKRWTLIVSKRDGTNGSVLGGAAFTLRDQASGEMLEGTTNAAGRLIFKELDSDASYTLHETQAPNGYDTAEDITVSSPDGSTQRVMVTDERKPAGLTIRKVSDIDGSSLPGAVFAITCPDGNVLYGTTGESGLVELTGLAWGTYTIKETAAPAGYRISEEEETLDLGPDATGQAAEIVVKDRQDDTKARLLKYEAKTDGTRTDAPLQGAVFGLYREYDDRLLGTYVTGSDGTITLTRRLAYGDYYWLETRPPAGYVKDTEKHPFTVSPDAKEPSVTTYNIRRAGSVTLTKTSDLGDPVPGAVYTLYDENKETIIRESETDGYGILSMYGLEWGVYYLKETVVPQGFVEDAEWRRVIIGKASTNHDIEVTEISKKGTVRLTKVDAETKAARLEGAVYALYKTDGTLVSEGHTTGTDGTLEISGIPWGSYYLKETEAPAGYSLSADNIRFSVNAANAGKTQVLTAEDPKDVKNVVITKKIKAGDINFANGEPCFIFRLSGTDVNGKPHTYEAAVRFSPSAIENHTDADGWTSAQCRFNDLTAGTYTASEIDTARYELTAVDDVTGGEIGPDGKSVIFDLIDSPSGSASFYNERYEQGYFSETAIIDNIVKAKARLTSIGAFWRGETEQEIGSHIDKELLTVKAFYDDGTEKILMPEEFTLDINELPMQAGQYTIRVTYIEDGVTCQDSFELLAGALRPGTVMYDANGGYFFEDKNQELNRVVYVWNGQSNETIYGTYADPENDPDLHVKFNGWYTDRECTTKLDLTHQLTEGIVAYAKWTPIPPDVKYAVCVYGIGQDTDENGNTMGLTFGPAVGDDYTKTFVNHDPTGVTALGNPHRCIHDDMESGGWDLIIYWNNTDPEVYEQCMGDADTPSCTTHVDIFLNDSLRTNSGKGNLTGDGASVIYNEIKQELRKWNNIQSYSGGYAASRRRAVLNGVDEYAQENIAGSDIFEGGATPMTEETCLFSCLPTVLKNAIGRRKTVSPISYNSSTMCITYDRLITFTKDEFTGNVYQRTSLRAIGTGNDNENCLKRRLYTYAGQGANAWLSSLYRFSGQANYIYYRGSVLGQQVPTVHGFILGFALSRA